jgi:putative inorganic carbon (hco3(-)) transporter
MVLTDLLHRGRAAAPGLLARSLRSPANWAVGLLLLMIPVTLWISAWPDLTLPQVWQLLAGIAAYYAMRAWATSSARAHGAAWGLVLLGLGLALLTPFGVRWGAHKLPFVPPALYARLPTLLPDPINPNVMGGALALLLPLAVALAVFNWRSLRPLARLAVWTAAASMAVMLVLVQSRGALLGSAVAMIVLCVLRWRRGWLMALVALMAAGLGIWRIGLDRAVAMLATTESFGGLPGRLEIWSRAWYVLQDFPFTGAGMGAFRPVVNALYPFFSFAPDAAPPHAHNLYLQVGVDLGLPGLLAWLTLLLLAGRAAWLAYRHGRRTHDAQTAGLAAGLLASLAALATHGCLDAAVWGTRPAVIVWLLWGLAIALASEESGVTAHR